MNIHSTFFHNEDDALNYLLDRGILHNSIICGCHYSASLEKHRGKYTYRCQNKQCRKRMCITKNTPFEKIKHKINDILLIFFCFLYNMRNYQICGLVGISEPSLIKIKKSILLSLRNYRLSIMDKIGGENIRVQVDETVIVRGRVINNPSNTDDEIPRSVWLVGGIEETEEKRFFLKIVPNRRIETMEEVLRDNIAEGSIIVSDGHPSYPQAVRNNNFQHFVVNHSVGFVNEEGDHTNNIENLWSHLKSELRLRHGILREEMERFIEEFTFRRLFLKNKSSENLNSLFYEVLNYMFGN